MVKTAGCTSAKTVFSCNPEKFVFFLKARELISRKDFNSLVDMGANHMQEMLGTDDT